MAIRNAEVVCSLGYNARKALEEESGHPVLTPGLYIKGHKVHSGEVVLQEANLEKNSLPEYDRLFSVKDEISHVGCVVDIYTEYGVRIMSDVWSDLTFAVVYEPEGPMGYDSESFLQEVANTLLPDRRVRLFRTVGIGSSEGGRSGFYWNYGETVAEVDAPQDVLDIYEGAKAGKSFAQAERVYNGQQWRIAQERKCVKKDRLVRVTRGRKVPRGIEGKVFWIGNTGWGTKLGIATPQEDGSFRMVKKPGKYGKIYESYADVVWVHEKNVEVIDRIGGRIV